MCDQQRLGPACAYVQSDQSLCQSLEYSLNIKLLPEHHLVGWLVGFVALRPKSTAMVIAGRSVHLTTLFPGQA